MKVRMNKCCLTHFVHIEYSLTSHNPLAHTVYFHVGETRVNLYGAVKIKMNYSNKLDVDSLIKSIEVICYKFKLTALLKSMLCLYKLFLTAEFAKICNAFK